MYPSTEMLISVQKYNGKISPILSTQITVPVKNYQSLSAKT